MRRWGWVLMIAALVSTANFGCSPSSDTGPPPVEEYKRTTPDNLLLFFAEAYKGKEIDDYADALDANFLFQFTNDVANDIGLPADEPWWGKSDDEKSTRTMFDEPTVTDITFSYEFVTPEWDLFSVDRDDTTFSGVWRRLDPLIQVTTITESEIDPILTYRVDSSWLDVYVVPDRYTEGLWTILKIEESEKQI